MDDGAAEVVRVERSNHKPPYWMSWGTCNGCDADYGGCNIRDLNLNYDATGPAEEGYEFRLENERKGFWWPEPIKETWKEEEMLSKEEVGIDDYVITKTTAGKVFDIMTSDKNCTVNGSVFSKGCDTKETRHMLKKIIEKAYWAGYDKGKKEGN